MTCKWHKDAYEWEDHDYWETSCDNLFQFNDGGPKENHFEYCPYCGKRIDEVDDERV